MEGRLLFAGLALFGLGTVLVVVAGFILRSIIDDIDAQTTPQDRIGDTRIGDTPANFKLANIRSRYRTLFPTGMKWRRMNQVGYAGLGFVLVAVVIFQFLFERARR